MKNPMIVKEEDEGLELEPYVFQLHRFPWNFLHYPGYAYVGGTIVGRVKGTVDGLREAEKAGKVWDSGRVVGKRYGSYAGAWGLIYGCLESHSVYIRGGVDDPLNSFVAGFGTAAIYKARTRPSTVVVVVRGGVLGGLIASSFVSGLKLLLS